MALIDKYTPYDYRDTFSREVDPSRGINVDTLFERMFCDLPFMVRWLFDLRNKIMMPFGFKGEESFRDLVTDHTDEEIIICKTDSHIDFWVGISCTTPADGKQTASVTTVVRFNSLLGKLYFISIWIFHRLLAGSLLRRATR